MFGFLALGYTFVLTLIRTVASGYPEEYSGWVLARFLQWGLLISLVLFRLEERPVRRLLLGVLLGGVINAFAAVLDLLGYSVSTMLLRYVDLSRAGPWAVVVDDPFGVLVSGANGIFSFSRTATGFFLALSAASALLLVSNRLFRGVTVGVLAIGILATGSRLGFLSMMVVLVMFLIGTRSKGVIASFAVVAAVVALVLPAFFGDVLENPLIARLFGLGEDDFISGYEGRSERQQIILSLSTMQLLLGTGAGNLGFALGLDREGFNLYGAHGFLFQYFASVGLFGALLFFALIIAVMTNRRISGLAWGLLGAAVLCSVSDDFFFPNPSGGHIPVIFALLLRLAAPLTSATLSVHRPKKWSRSDQAPKLQNAS